MNWGNCKNIEELADESRNSTASRDMVALAKEFIWQKERWNEHAQQRQVHLMDYNMARQRADELLQLANDSRGFDTFGKPEYINLKDRCDRQIGFANECCRMMRVRNERMARINQKMKEAR